MAKQKARDKIVMACIVYSRQGLKLMHYFIFIKNAFAAFLG